MRFAASIVVLIYGKADNSDIRCSDSSSPGWFLAPLGSVFWHDCSTLPTTYSRFALENGIDTHDHSSHTRHNTVCQPAIRIQDGMTGKITHRHHIRSFLQLDDLRVYKLTLVVHNHKRIHRTLNVVAIDTHTITGSGQNNRREAASDWDDLDAATGSTHGSDLSGSGAEGRGANDDTRNANELSNVIRLHKEGASVTNACQQTVSTSLHSNHGSAQHWPRIWELLGNQGRPSCWQCWGWKTGFSLHCLWRQFQTNTSIVKGQCQHI